MRFAHQSRMTHYKHMKNSMNLPSNHKYKEEVGALLGMPIHSLVSLLIVIYYSKIILKLYFIRI